MPKVRYVKLPVVTLTQKQAYQKMDEVKERSGKSVDFDKVGNPIAQPKASRKPPTNPTVPTHQRRRGPFCRVMGPEEWNLIFPEYPSEYGGTVCVLR